MTPGVKGVHKSYNLFVYCHMQNIVNVLSKSILILQHVNMGTFTLKDFKNAKK